MTFPLPLVPFERYMLADNSAGYPRVFVIEAGLSGSLDRGAFEAAWSAALARHPMLRARIISSRGARRWELNDATLPAIDWDVEGVALGFKDGEMIDLESEPGLRAWVRVADNTARLVLQFHHACCDGVAGLQFVGEVLAEYARRTSPAESIAPLPALEPELLNNRGTFGLARPTFREWLGHAWMTLSESWRLLARSVAPVELPRSTAGEAATPPAFPGYETFLFDRCESAQLHHAARQAGGTLNDLLMCYLLRTIVDWNEANGVDNGGRWLRINVPTNLRRREDLAMPAANIMSFTFIDRKPADCLDASVLLTSIRDEMQRIKQRRLGLYFIAQLALVGRMPGGMGLVVSGRRCFATAVLTNLGDATKAFSVNFPRRGDKLAIGNMVLESLVGTPPLRPLTRTGVAVASYAGRLVVCLLCDRHHFTREQTRQFLDAYIAEIRRGLESQDNVPAAEASSPT